MSLLLIFVVLASIKDVGNITSIYNKYKNKIKGCMCVGAQPTLGKLVTLSPITYTTTQKYQCTYIKFLQEKLIMMSLLLFFITHFHMVVFFIIISFVASLSILIFFVCFRKQIFPQFQHVITAFTDILLSFIIAYIRVITLSEFPFDWKNWFPILYA